MATAVLMSNQKLLTFLQRYEKMVFVSLPKRSDFALLL